MKNRSIAVRAIAGITALLLFAGCSAKNVQKDASYDKQLTEVSIVAVPALFKPNGKGNLHEIFNQQALFVLQRASSSLAKELAAKNVAVTPVNAASQTLLIIQPKNAKRTCTTRNGAIIGCSDEVWYGVYLQDKTVKKVVWSGDFKVAGNPSTYSEKDKASVMERFAKMIVKEMDRSKLLAHAN